MTLDLRLRVRGSLLALCVLSTALGQASTSPRGSSSCPPALPAGGKPRFLFAIAGMSNPSRLDHVAPSLWRVHAMAEKGSIELTACIVSVHASEAALPSALVEQRIPPSCRVARHVGASLFRHLLLLPADVVARSDFVTVHIDSARLAEDVDLGVLGRIMIAVRLCPPRAFAIACLCVLERCLG